jgi:hypothetical protein
LLTAERLELEVRLLPLLARRFELVELRLVGPVIALESDGKGQRNWESGASAPKTPAGPVATEAGTPAAFAAGNFSVTNGALTYRDGASGAVTRVSIERLSLRARDSRSAIAAEFRGKVDAVAVAVEGSLGPLQDLLEQRWPYPVTLQGDVAGRNAALTTKIRAEGARYTLDDLDVKFGANALKGTFAVVTGGTRPAVAFDLAGSALDVKELPVPAAAAPATTAPASRAASSHLFSDAHSTSRRCAPSMSTARSRSIACNSSTAGGSTTSAWSLSWREANWSCRASVPPTWAGGSMAT